MAAELTPGFSAFTNHFALRQLSSIFSISYQQAKLLPHDEAMFARLADQKKVVYLSHFHRLTQPVGSP
ncbi:hypothetical protein GCM10028807_32590 [Spirosoma daeguense]